MLVKEKSYTDTQEKNSTICKGPGSSCEGFYNGFPGKEYRQMLLQRRYGRRTTHCPVDSLTTPQRVERIRSHSGGNKPSLY